MEPIPASRSGTDGVMCATTRYVPMGLQLRAPKNKVMRGSKLNKVVSDKKRNSEYSLRSEIHGIDKLGRRPINKPIPEDKVKERLAKLRDDFTPLVDDFVGYQVNEMMDHKYLKDFCDLHMNNIGDPYGARDFNLNTAEMEVETIEFMLGVLNYPDRYPKELNGKENPESGWGYVSAGGSESNIYSIYAARKTLVMLDEGENRRRPELKNVRPIGFASSVSHYSVPKAFDVTGVELNLIPVQNEQSGCEGQIDLKIFEKVLREKCYGRDGKLKARPLISANVGSTFHGTFDDVQAIIKILEQPKPLNGVNYEALKPDDYWLHVDGALGMGYLPYLEDVYHAQRRGKKIVDGDVVPDQLLTLWKKYNDAPENENQRRLQKDGFPVSDARLEGVDSCCVSGHKCYGSPFPYSMVMMRRKYLGPVSHEVTYIGTKDTTLAGSRSGHAPIVLWKTIASNGTSGFRKAACRMLEMSFYAWSRMKLIGWPVKKADPLAVSVLFLAPYKYYLEGEKYGEVDMTHPASIAGKELIHTYTLSTDYLKHPAYPFKAKWCHMFTMAHVTEEAIDHLVGGLAAWSLQYASGTSLDVKVNSLAVFADKNVKQLKEKHGKGQKRKSMEYAAGAGEPAMVVA